MIREYKTVCTQAKIELIRTNRLLENEYLTNCILFRMKMRELTRKVRANNKPAFIAWEVFNLRQQDQRDIAICKKLLSKG